MKGLLALAVVATIASACGPGARPPCVVVLGVDALHLPLLDQLVEQGALPHFGRLYREGTAGAVVTRAAGLPPLSPRIWTTFATGRLPRDHGIENFVGLDADGQQRPLDSRDRRVPALWEIASLGGKRVGVVNWIATYPAEAVTGFVITDYYLVLPSASDREPLVHPPELAKTLATLGLKPRPAAITMANAESMDRDVFRATFAAWERDPVDLLMIYTRGLDELSHLVWWTHEPLPDERPKADRVIEYMRRYDSLLGELLDRLGARDHLVVLSDHGMERNPDKRALSGVHARAHLALGVQMWWGPGVPAGVRRASSLLDVAPTVLELLGLPPPADMPGTVLSFVFPPEHVLLARRQEPYPRLADAGGRKERSAADAEVVERLRALGYVR